MANTCAKLKRISTELKKASWILFLCPFNWLWLVISLPSFNKSNFGEPWWLMIYYYLKYDTFHRIHPPLTKRRGVENKKWLSGINFKSWGGEAKSLGGQVNFSAYTLYFLPYCSYILSWVDFSTFLTRNFKNFRLRQAFKILLVLIAHLIVILIWAGFCGTSCRLLSDWLEHCLI